MWFVDDAIACFGGNLCRVIYKNSCISILTTNLKARAAFSKARFSFLEQKFITFIAEFVSTVAAR